MLTMEKEIKSEGDLGVRMMLESEDHDSVSMTLSSGRDQVYLSPPMVEKMIDAIKSMKKISKEVSYD